MDVEHNHLTRNITPDTCPKCKLQVEAWKKAGRALLDEQAK